MEGLADAGDRDYFNPQILQGRAHIVLRDKNPLEANLAGFLVVLECCRNSGVKNLLFASSSSVYGMSGDVPYTEASVTDAPVSLYAATKKADELMAHAYCRLYGINMAGLRYFTVYGPWGRPDMAPMLFARAIMSGESIKVFNNGDSDIDTLTLTYRINQEEAVSETFFERIQMQTKKKLVFSQYVDFSQEDTYIVEVKGECANDTNTSNNTLIDTTEHIVPYTTPWESDMSFSDWKTDADGAWAHVEAESGNYLALRKMGSLVSHCISLEPGKYILRYEYQAGHMISYFPWGVYFNVSLGPAETDPWLWPNLKKHSNANTGDEFEWAELSFEIEQGADYSLAFLPLTVDTLFIREVVLTKMAENDMTIPYGPELPRTIPCSQSGGLYTFRIPTQNRGLQDATGVVVSLYENGQLLGQSSPGMIPAEQTIDIAVPAMLPSYAAGPVKFKAEVAFGLEDAYPENDTLPFIINFSDSTFLFDMVEESQMAADGGLGANYPIEAGYVIDLQIPDTLTSVTVGFCESVDMPFGIAVYNTDGAVKGKIKIF